MAYIMINLGITAAFITTLLWIVNSLVVKKTSSSLGNYRSSLIIITIGIIPMIAAAMIFGIGTIETYQIAISAAAGIFLCLGFILIFKSLETEQLTNTVVLGEMQPAILTLFGVFVLNNSLNMPEAASILLIFAGAFFVITHEGVKINKKLIPALLGNISWTIYWILMSIAISPSAFAEQMAVSRFVGLSLLLALFYFGFAKISTKKLSAPRLSASMSYPIILLAIVAGLLDGTGDTLFGFTMHLNVIAAGAAITALVPVFVSLFSFILYHDKLTKPQLIGFVVMVAGALSLAVFY
jgi:drug/metabolite transporter (DMT)-like permease